jgi:hypothetical protein
MAAATFLVHPTLPTRCLPPTLRQRCGGLQKSRQLQRPRRHHFPPPSNPFPLGVPVLHTPREGMPIHSVTDDLLFHHGSAHNEITILVVFANITAHRLPIHRSTFSVGGNTSPALPTNLLVMAGIRRGGWDSLSSCSFGGTFWETIFLVEGYLLFVFLSFGSFWLIVTWCIVLLLHPLPSVLLALFVHLPFSFSASQLCP